MTRLGGTKSVLRELVIYESVSAEIITPGWITPPRKVPSAVMQS